MLVGLSIIDFKIYQNQEDETQWATLYNILAVSVPKEKRFQSKFLTATEK